MATMTASAGIFRRGRLGVLADPWKVLTETDAGEIDFDDRLVPAIAARISALLSHHSINFGPAPLPGTRESSPRPRSSVQLGRPARGPQNEGRGWPARRRAAGVNPQA